MRKKNPIPCILFFGDQVADMASRCSVCESPVHTTLDSGRCRVCDVMFHYIDAQICEGVAFPFSFKFIVRHEAHFNEHVEDFLAYMERTLMVNIVLDRNNMTYRPGDIMYVARVYSNFAKSASKV